MFEQERKYAELVAEVSEQAKPRAVAHFAISLIDAINRAGLDMCTCGLCGQPVLCPPDGMPLCEMCAKEEGL